MSLNIKVKIQNEGLSFNPKDKKRKGTKLYKLAFCAEPTNSLMEFPNGGMMIY